MGVNLMGTLPVWTILGVSCPPTIFQVIPSPSRDWFPSIFQGPQLPEPRQIGGGGAGSPLSDSDVGG